MGGVERGACDSKKQSKIAEKKEYMAAWRKNNREHIRQYNKIYRMKKRLCGGAKDEKGD